MSGDKIERMANQIAAGLGDGAAVAAHINDFWAPPMREKLLAALAHDPSPYAQAVREAASAIRPAPVEG